MDFGIERFGKSNITSLLVSYYVAVASVFEPQRFPERMAWAKTTTLVDTISSFFSSPQLSKEDKRDFVDEFRNAPTSLQPSKWVFLKFSCTKPFSHRNCVLSLDFSCANLCLSCLLLRNGKPWHGLMIALQGTLHEIALDALMVHRRDVHPQLHHAVSLYVSYTSLLWQT